MIVLADYYEMLGVDPRSDRGVIEAALAKAQPAWSAGTRNPKNKHTFQSYLDRIPAIRQALLGDLSARAAYDAELAASQRAAIDAKLDELQRRIRLRAAKGGLTISDRTLLRQEAVRIGLPATEADRLGQPYPPMPESPIEQDPVDPVLDVIDPVSRRQIRIALEHIRRRDLYDALGLPRDAPRSEVAARADSERQRWMQKTHVTAEKTAWLEAISYAQTHLSIPDARARYDRTLQVEAEDMLRESIEFALKGTTSLGGMTRVVLRDQASAAGITVERADRLIDRVCRELGVSRDGGPAPQRVEGLIRYLRCRSCSGLTEYALASRSTDSAFCQHCRASLQWSCPICKRSRWVDESRCACGFPLEYVEPLVRYFEAANHAHRSRDFTAALASLRKVQEFAPTHVGARKGIEKIKERLAEIDQARAAYEVQRARRHLIAAQNAVIAWGRLVDPTSSELRRASTEVAEGIRRAMALAAKAETVAEEDPSAARTLFRLALSIAADLPGAREGIRHGPPPPPSDLHATLSGDRVRLRWTAAPADGLGPCTYRVVRKRGTVPVHANDGFEVAEVDATEFDDSTATPGDTLGYAIFSIRGETPSTQGAPAGPVPILADVSALKAEAESRRVSLTWREPPNCFGVRVVRKLGSTPAGPGDGTEIPALRDQAFDSGLIDETVYHYGVFVLYKTTDGRTIPSRGEFVRCMPSAPIRTVVEAVVRHDRDGVRISWTPPERGQVQIFRTTARLSHPPGAVSDRRVVDGFAGSWVPCHAPDHVVDGSPSSARTTYYVPMIAWAGRLTVGRTAKYLNLEDCSGLRAPRAPRGDKIALTWRWPEESIATILACRNGLSPEGPADPLAQIVRITKSEFESSGSHLVELPSSGTGPWHVAAFAVHLVDGSESIAPAGEPTSRATITAASSAIGFTYTIHSPGLVGRWLPFLGYWTVRIRTEPPGAAIPPTVVVAHERSVPWSAEDGQVVARLPAACDGELARFRPRLRIGQHRLRIFVDPKTTPGSGPPIVVHHPEAESARI